MERAMTMAAYCMVATVVEKTLEAERVICRMPKAVTSRPSTNRSLSKRYGMRRRKLVGRTEQRHIPVAPLISASTRSLE
ncbi:hypothetical protein ACFLWZ_07060 [Chloroflexota bacterium]